MHPWQHARTHPDRVAFAVADTGERLTYRELDEASNRGAHLFRELGLRAGDTMGLLLKNCAGFPIAYWAAQRAGLMIAPLSTHLQPAEAAHILNDCRAKVLVTAAEVGATAAILAAQRETLVPNVQHVLNVSPDVLPGAASWQKATAARPVTPIADETAGYFLLYSGGTTGRPKGVVQPFGRDGPIEAESATEQNARNRLGTHEPLVAFNGAPLYHAAPLVMLVAAQRMGATVVVLKKFDAIEALAAIESWRATYAHFVPTMFVRMLRLPEDVRLRYDLSSLKKVMHAAAPCPIEVKRRMFAWLGPLIHEYSMGSEGNGQCYITPEEWLRKPGSVGRPTWGALRICDDNGDELPTGRDGLVYFESSRSFEYLNDPEKTAKARHPRHPTWTTLGDIGHVDEDGYLFLTDRKDFMIISGGVNIYPQAVEDALALHPQVGDVAVIGVPNAEYGEEVKAVVQPADGIEPTDELARELIAYCRERLSGVNCPRSVDFVRELPRLPTGKLAKNELRRAYWPPKQSPSPRPIDGATG